METPLAMNRSSEDYFNKHTDDQKLNNDLIKNRIESKRQTFTL